jgi:type II secretory pathway pseudopilin PulG
MDVIEDMQMKRMKKPLAVESRRRCAGITLVEVLIAVSLVSVAFMGVLSTYTTSLTIQKELDDRAKATFIAQQVLEEAATIGYDDLEYGYEMDYYEDELSGYLCLIRIVQGLPDQDIAEMWTRFPDPDPSSAYKLVTVCADWGDFQRGWENVKLDWIRVRRENTVEFEERVSTQAQ